ncbi:hypothetical protein R3P38DRAFT_1579093 [Favolaschia claudopus]|uniref:Uncharacterized protein n=1 Tax=Favolaschia claudopus TaxID=2862362 RepID=A0AAW0AIR1_9AGAR
MLRRIQRITEDIPFKRHSPRFTLSSRFWHVRFSSAFELRSVLCRCERGAVLRAYVSSCVQAGYSGQPRTATEIHPDRALQNSISISLHRFGFSIGSGSVGSVFPGCSRTECLFIPVSRGVNNTRIGRFPRIWGTQLVMGSHVNTPPGRFARILQMRRQWPRQPCSAPIPPFQAYQAQPAVGIGKYYSNLAETRARSLGFIQLQNARKMNVENQRTSGPFPFLPSFRSIPIIFQVASDTETCSEWVFLTPLQAARRVNFHHSGMP